MSQRQTTPAADVERLLREAGVTLPPPSSPRRRRGPWGRLPRRLRLRLLWLALCLLVALGAMFRLTIGPVGDGLGPPATGHDARFGVVEAFAAPDAATTLGVGWERMVFWWKSLQPDGPGSWNAFATGHDAAIAAERAAGRRIVGLLINTPDWAAVDPGQHGASVPSGLYRPYDDPANYWGHFVSMIAQRYAGRIDDWIIWNEVNIPSGQFHTWAGSVADYAQLVKVAYLAARAVNLHARIVLAGDPYWYDHGAFFRALLGDLTHAPGAAAHGAYFDAANLHLYSRPDQIAPIVGQYRADLARAGLVKPIWIAETNAIPYDDTVRLLPRGKFYATLDDQASYIIDAFAIDLALGVQRMAVNRMLDGSDFAAGGEPFGLVRNDGTPRPAFRAYCTVVNLFSGVTGGTIHIDPATGIETVSLRKPGASIAVVWDQRPSGVTAHIPARAATAVVYDKFGNRRTIAARHGVFALRLFGATGNTNSADPRDYVIGGSPLILVQQG